MPRVLDRSCSNLNLFSDSKVMESSEESSKHCGVRLLNIATHRSFGLAVKHQLAQTQQAKG